ncbi:hypothetical protein Agub_g15869, partial [Astrephomene gubernaculifera]
RAQAGSEAAVAAAGGGTGTAGGGGSSSRPCRTLAQALTLLDIRLRCGLMTEAFMLIRQHTADLAAAAAAAAGRSEAPAAAAAAVVGAHAGGSGGAEVAEHTG